MMTSFNLDFGGFKITQRLRDLKSGQTRIGGDLHRLTPLQFDALIEAFDLDNGYNTPEKVHTLTVPKTGKTFRTTSINMGGLIVTLYSDVPETVTLPIN